MDIVKTHQGVFYVDRESGHSYTKVREGKAGQAFLFNENIRLGKETNPFLHDTFYYLLENNVQNWNNLL